MNIETEQKINSWLEEPFDLDTREKVKALIALSPKELEDSFYTDLSFGTGGLRGLMGVGTNRMNRYTIRKTTQGLSNYLKKELSSKGLSVVIGFDNRLHSEEFAKEACDVLIQNGIDVFFCEKLRPTPYISFACRYCKADAAIMITASHNPKEYNGYKVYWQDGAQVVSPHDEGILQEIHQLKDFSIQTTSHPGTLHPLNEKLDDAYLNALRPLQNFPEENKEFGKDLHIVYTSLHGTGITLAPKALADWGFSSISLVTKQVIVDGNFPTVQFPNPERLDTLKEGLALLETTSADLLLATDPDADRLGVAVSHKGNSVVLTGNEIASICAEYLCLVHKKIKNPAIVTTIVSTDLIRSVCQAHLVSCFDVLTGFKYIGEKIHLWEQDPLSPSFLFGAEESYGYLYGTHSRDKDGIISCCLLAEIALYCKRQRKTLVDFLHEIYQKYGVFKEHTCSIDFAPGKDGVEAIQKLMDHLRNYPPLTLCGLKVVATEDYLQSNKTNLPKSDVLLFKLEDGSKLIIRPSGTEPKLKIYVSTHMSIQSDVQEAIFLTETKLQMLIKKITQEILSY
ncbi:MAG: phospho-sugar mutase [Chlamydiota bacterium]